MKLSIVTRQSLDLRSYLRKIKLNAFVAVIAVLIPLTSTFSSGPASAHSQGVPYVLINNHPVTVNPAGNYNYNVAQDLAPQNYLPDQQLEVSIDSSVIGGPGYSFRWNLDDSPTYLTGDKVTLSISALGTHSLSLDMKSSAGDFSNIDKINVNIVPTQSYILPDAQVMVKQLKAGKPGYGFQLTALNHRDLSTKIQAYAWDINPGQTITGQVVSASVGPNAGNLFPVLRLKDSNNLETDWVFQMTLENGRIKALDVPGQLGVVKQSRGNLTDRLDQYKWQLLIFGLLVVLAGGWSYEKGRRKRSKPPRD